MYYFIVNPKSSSGKGYRIYKKIEPLLKKSDVAYRVYFTKSGENATRLAHKICSEKAPCTLVAVGGDGTINDVLNGLCNFDSILFGYLPTGSGNDLARGLGLSSNPKAAITSILNPATIVPLSMGILRYGQTSRRFLVSSGIGFDADVCRLAVDSKVKRYLNRIGLGKLTYAGLALKSMFRLSSSTLTLTLDDQPPVSIPDLLFAAAMNLKYEGGGFMFCPDADPQDEYLDLIVADSMPWHRIIRILPTALIGKHTGFSGIQIHRFQKAQLTLQKPFITHTDGEPQGEYSSIHWEIEKNKLSFIIH